MKKISYKLIGIRSWFLFLFFIIHSMTLSGQVTFTVKNEKTWSLIQDVNIVFIAENKPIIDSALTDRYGSARLSIPNDSCLKGYIQVSKRPYYPYLIEYNCKEPNAHFDIFLKPLHESCGPFAIIYDRDSITPKSPLSEYMKYFPRRCHASDSTVKLVLNTKYSDTYATALKRVAIILEYLVHFGWYSDDVIVDINRAKTSKIYFSLVPEDEVIEHIYREEYDEN